MENENEKSVQYVDGEMQLSKYLKVKDFTHSPTAVANNIDNRLPVSLLENAKKIAAIYDRIYDQFKGKVKLNSGYRSLALNRRVGGSTTSQHVRAQAIDVDGVNGVKNSQILSWVLRNVTYNQVIHEYGTATEPAWVHIGFGTKMQFLKIGVKGTKALTNMLGEEVDI
jgi:uncharacterized protein YcbK (DUF882 family)